MLMPQRSCRGSKGPGDISEAQLSRPCPFCPPVLLPEHWMSASIFLSLQQGPQLFCVFLSPHPLIKASRELASFPILVHKGKNREESELPQSATSCVAWGGSHPVSLLSLP